MFRNNLSEKFVSDGPEILIKLNPEWPRHANVADFLFCLLETFCRSFQWPTKLHVAAGFKGWISQSEFIRRLIVKFGSTDMGVPGWGDKAISKVIAKKKKIWEREKNPSLLSSPHCIFSTLSRRLRGLASVNGGSKQCWLVTQNKAARRRRRLFKGGWRDHYRQRDGARAESIYQQQELEHWGMEGNLNSH